MDTKNNDNLGAQLHSTMDAHVWATEFHRLNNASDLDMMRAWFANAIMVGYDFGKRELAAAPAPAGQQGQEPSAEPKCWSCRKPYSMEARADADGNCPHCGVEIEVAAPASAKPVAPAVKLRAFRAAHDKTWHVVVEHPFGTSWVKMGDPRDIKLAELLAAAPVAPAKPVAPAELDYEVWNFARECWEPTDENGYNAVSEKNRRIAPVAPVARD